MNFPYERIVKYYIKHTHTVFTPDQRVNKENPLISVLSGSLDSIYFFSLLSVWNFSKRGCLQFIPECKRKQSKIIFNIFKLKCTYILQKVYNLYSLMKKHKHFFLQKTFINCARYYYHIHDCVFYRYLCESNMQAISWSVLDYSNNK